MDGAVKASSVEAAADGLLGSPCGSAAHSEMCWKEPELLKSHVSSAQRFMKWGKGKAGRSGSFYRNDVFWVFWAISGIACRLCSAMCSCGPVLRHVTHMIAHYSNLQHIVLCNYRGMFGKSAALRVTQCHRVSFKTKASPQCGNMMLVFDC